MLVYVVQSIAEPSLFLYSGIRVAAGAQMKPFDGRCLSLLPFNQEVVVAVSARLEVGGTSGFKSLRSSELCRGKPF